VPTTDSKETYNTKQKTQYKYIRKKMFSQNTYTRKIVFEILLGVGGGGDSLRGGRGRGGFLV